MKYQDHLIDFRSRKETINVAAATVVYSNLIKILENIKSDLTGLNDDIDRDSFNKVRNLVINFSHLDYVELNIFSAFKAPKDDIFYQKEDSESWIKLKDLIVDFRAKGELDKYAD